MRCFLYIALFFIGIQGVFCQSDQLAQKYLEQGEYAKALSVYQNLVKEAPGNSNYFLGLVTSYQQLEDFAMAESLLQERLKDTNNNPTILIELGHNYELQNKPELAKKQYTGALSVLNEKANYAYAIARNFEKYSLLDYAEQAYVLGMQLRPEMNFDLPLARIYGEQGKLDEMFAAYLELIAKQPEMSINLMREFDRYILEDASNLANIALRKQLLQKLQKTQELTYSELLAWLFIQQKDFDKAFLQEKAIYRRNNRDLQRIIQLTVLAKSENDIETAKEIVSFIIEETTSPGILVQANQLLLDMKLSTAKGSDFKNIEKDFEKVLSEFGTGLETMAVQIDYANFLAFKMDKIEEAKQLLNTLSKNPLNNFQQAAIKMVLADILVLDQKFNQALIYYSQVQTLVKNDEIAQNARFKVAKTSYFKGDFAWALTQLNVLKASTTQLIANDALELSLLIKENSLEDSTQTALKLYAKADLLAFQNKPIEAIGVLNDILQNHKGEKIEDEALLKQAELFKLSENWNKAEENYLKILEFYGKDILADNATFLLAALYDNQLENPEKAKQYYEQIIFNFPDSIYFVDARKKYRALRGDEVEQ
ncbi:tetratricopeptide repeat protein [Gillisia sp. Hel_I_86]|uniref:tetratricopeptide repeat protein n=1 Tax=Gillisia sp. Hel_I_86 TaxID=1249981 RepID=UPI0011997F68|nr:tetratricopeptide repeat protein [Gillisia sp. Hel_I_86]TVZ25996.1 tetratricopeptide repeat protein [Gillisia sp. Hel_I_86]